MNFLILFLTKANSFVIFMTNRAELFLSVQEPGLLELPLKEKCVYDHTFGEKSVVFLQQFNW